MPLCPAVCLHCQALAAYLIFSDKVNDDLDDLDLLQRRQEGHYGQLQLQARKLTGQRQSVDLNSDCDLSSFNCITASADNDGPS